MSGSSGLGLGLALQVSDWLYGVMDHNSCHQLFLFTAKEC